MTVTQKIKVAVLGVAAKSIYKTFTDVECFDAKRDLRSFSGGMPILAHPPCRSWSAYCAHQAKPLPGEKELGPFCVDWLRKCGGILEHPAHSRLFAACGLPKPGETDASGAWTAQVLQAWWGDTRTKKTWLCFFGIPRSQVVFPYRLHNPQGDRRRWQVMCKQQRSATNPALAEWLVETVRKVGPLVLPGTRLV